MINDAVKNGYQPPTPIRSAVSAALPLAAADSSAAAVNAKPATENASDPQPVTDPKRLAEAVTKLNDYVQNIRRNLSFSIEESTGRTVVKVYDAETEELIRQIPSEETLRLAAAIEEQTSSLFIQERT